MNHQFKARLKWVAVLAAATMLLIANWSALSNPGGGEVGCQEHGPHESWTCVTPGGISNPGHLAWTNGYYCLGNAIEAPTLLGFIANAGFVSHNFTYDCPANFGQNSSESVGNDYFPELSFDPALPAVANFYGTNSYNVYVKGIPRIDCCTNTSAILLCVVKLICLNSTVDTDSDTLPDCWELHYFRNLTQGPNGDYDDDGFSNHDEYVFGTDPTHSDDSDSDHLPDLIDAYPYVYDTTEPTFTITAPAEGAVF